MQAWRILFLPSRVPPEKLSDSLANSIIHKPAVQLDCSLSLLEFSQSLQEASVAEQEISEQACNYTVCEQVWLLQAEEWKTVWQSHHGLLPGACQDVAGVGQSELIGREQSNRVGLGLP